MKERATTYTQKIASLSILQHTVYVQSNKQNETHNRLRDPLEGII